MQIKRFQTFEGVFTPCLLSILGVIMYLRLGWVVGQVGIGGALVIIGFANVLSLFTTLSMSSVVTNIRIGAGGAYSIITKSLGTEAGGAIGIPLYLSQAISVAFYIAGFTECWISVFPNHYPILISIVLWTVLLVVSYSSAKMAFRLQYGIMAIIGLSLISIFLGPDKLPENPALLSGLGEGNFWAVFAIFFPAVTGILAGASMSGELVDPKSSIPKGTFLAVVVSFLIYVALAFWFATHVQPSDLINNTAIVIDSSRIGWLVVLGIMGATLSSALAMFVASPRTLLALGKHSVVPFSSSWGHINEKGEPTTSVLFTSLLVLITILLGNLNQVAGLLTMFFLITYGMINLTVFIEQTIGIVSFRPTFRVSRIIPFLGAVGCMVVMFLINTKFTLIAIAIIVITYFLLLRREVEVYSPDVRSGLLVFIAEQFAMAAAKLPYHPKIWKPNLLIHLKDQDEIDDILMFVRDIVFPSGRIMLYQITNQTNRSINERIERKEKLAEKLEILKEEGLFIRSSVLAASDFTKAAITTVDVSGGLFFPSNTLFCTLDENKSKDKNLATLIKYAEDEGLGVIVLNYHRQMGFSQEEIINLWIRKKSPNLDLSILITLQLEKNWEGRVRLIQVVKHTQEVEEAQMYLERLRTLMRLSQDTEIHVLVGEFKEALNDTPPADINIFGMPEEPDLAMIREVSGVIKTSVLFLRDSKHESAIA